MYTQLRDFYKFRTYGVVETINKNRNGTKRAPHTHVYVPLLHNESVIDQSCEFSDQNRLSSRPFNGFKLWYFLSDMDKFGHVSSFNINPQYLG